MPRSTSTNDVPMTNALAMIANICNSVQRGDREVSAEREEMGNTWQESWRASRFRPRSQESALRMSGTVAESQSGAAHLPALAVTHSTALILKLRRHQDAIRHGLR